MLSITECRVIVMNNIRKFISRPLAMWLILLFGLLGVFVFVNPSHAAAAYSCGVNNNGSGPGNNHQAAGLVVDVNWHPYGGSSLVDDNTSQVKVTTDRTDLGPVKNNPPPLPGHNSGAVAQMSPDDSSEKSLNDSMTFSQVPAGCTMYPNGQSYNGGREVVLGYGQTSPSNGWDYWALDCEEIIRANAGFINSSIYQPFTITGVGVPTGARAGGNWTVQSVQPVNGNTTYVTVTYYEPPPPQPSQGSCTYLQASNEGNYFHQRKRTHVQISGTNHDVDEYIPGQGGAGPNNTDTVTNNYNYWPQRNDISVTVTTEYLPSGSGTSWTPIGGSDHIRSFGQPCFSASCSINSVDGDGPGGIVLAGGTMHVHGTFTNTSPPLDNLPMYAGAFLDGPNGTNNLGFVPYAGYPVGFTLDLPAPPTVQTYSTSFTPQYNASESFMSGCPMSVPVYQHFSSSLGAKTDLKPTKENPYQGADYSTTVSVSETSHSVNIPTNSLFYKKPAAAAQQNIASNTGGTYTAPSQVAFSGHYDIPPGSFGGGDEYCVSIHANYTSGYVGPSSDVVAGAGPADAFSCPRVANEPYFKVYNAGISAGGDFAQFDQCTTAGGTLAGFNDISDPPGASRGSSSQLSALARIAITGVASAQSPNNINRSPTDLTFANTGVQVDPTGNESPVLGGNFGGCQTLTNETAPSTAGNIVLGTTSANRAAGAYKHSGNLTISGGTLPTGKNVSVFVNGDVYISGDIKYAQTAGWTAGTAPSFVLHATGNIYISPSVKTLSGLYIAQKTNSGATNGKIYTCADTVSHFAPMSASGIYGCKNQLVVYGSFVANQVNLMRSFGSLRDEAPNPGPPGGSTINLTWSCGGGDCNPDLSGLRCIHTNEPADPHTWDDNQLCVPSAAPIHLAWTHWPNSKYTDPNKDPAKNDPGDLSLDYLKTHGYPNCTLFDLPGVAGWDDPNPNYLCMDLTRGDGSPWFQFSKPNDPSQTCTRMYEPADTDASGWPAGYYLCQPTPAAAGAPTPKGPPFTSCSNKGTEIDTKSCAGEVFEFSPQLYLANPSDNPPSNGALQFQSITSLPPVL